LTGESVRPLLAEIDEIFKETIVIIKCRWLLKIFNIRGIMLFPFILVDRLDNKYLINHERIHFAQCLETGIVGFYVLYIIFHITGLFRHWSWEKAYEGNPFEVEAKTFELYGWYLPRRHRWAWRIHV